MAATMDERNAVSRAKAERERHWLDENRPAIAAYNLRVAQHGLLSDHAGVLLPVANNIVSR
jgi:post-segregation antitoxin (ccd killing protein)